MKNRIDMAFVLQNWDIVQSFRAWEDYLFTYLSYKRMFYFTYEVKGAKLKLFETDSGFQYLNWLHITFTKSK